MARGGWSQAPDDDAAEMYLRGLERFDAAGFEQYEISNVARRGRQCRHNLKYWADGEWLAFGCGAHGTRDGRGGATSSSTADYIARIRDGRDVVAERRELTPAGAGRGGAVHRPAAERRRARSIACAERYGLRRLGSLR